MLLIVRYLVNTAVIKAAWYLWLWGLIVTEEGETINWRRDWWFQRKPNPVLPDYKICGYRNGEYICRYRHGHTGAHWMVTRHARP